MVGQIYKLITRSKTMEKNINLKPRINKNNKQINFSLCKRKLPKEVTNKLPKLKSIKVNIKDFEFEL